MALSPMVLRVVKRSFNVDTEHLAGGVSEFTQKRLLDVAPYRGSASRWPGSTGPMLPA